MRTRARLAATAAALAALVGSPVPGTSSNATAQPAATRPASGPHSEPGSPEGRMERFERRLDEIEQQHRAELKRRDEEIAKLRDELRRSGDGTEPHPHDHVEKIPMQDSQVPDEHGHLHDPAAGEDASLHDHDHDHDHAPHSHDHAEQAHAPHAPADHDHGGEEGGSPLKITAVADFLATYSPDRDNDAYNRFDVREFHLDLRANLHRSADAVAILAFARDVENPIFPEFAEGGEEEEGGPETSVHVEEAYVFLHDFGVPGLTAKVGRFHVRFGRQNMLHLHELPTTDPPFVNQAFLAPESLTDAGVSVGYVIPGRLVGGQRVEVVGELLSGEGAGSESPTLRGDLSVDSPAFNAHVLWNTYLAKDLNFELGGSWLRGHGDEDNANDVNLFGVDATLVRRDPTGGFRNTMLQAEAMYAVVDQPDGGTEEAFGAYLLGQQQFSREWYAGMRLDWTENPNAANEEAWGVTPYVTWHWTEFLRFRLFYQHRGGDRPEEDVLGLQVTWLFGAHPAHPYWEVTH